ncbi:MAG: dTDP-glucose 4,6-dehydratase [Chloroflexi bacterium]|nr:dTDP-glucose 4,6-dehydratase [Chloroflexota bacterium]
MGRTFLVTGGAGFIGSNYAHYLQQHHPDYRMVIYDKLTYAGNLDNLKDILADHRSAFIQADICDAESVRQAIRQYGVDTIVNFAAESHVDRSILDAEAFIKTGVYGTYVLLEAAREFELRYHQVSTDEVYGDVPLGSSLETDPLCPNSPYSASKASGDLMVRAYHVTYGLNTTITRGSNTFGPYQYPEKVLPVFITNAIDDEALPMYGDGQQVRDWLYVMDHCSGIDLVVHRGLTGEAYNIGGDNERRNLDITLLILEMLGKPSRLIHFVQDRPGHDRRYSVDSRKLIDLGWQRSQDFVADLQTTLRWYSNNEWWWRKIKSGAYREYYQRQYGQRAVLGTYP